MNCLIYMRGSDETHLPPSQCSQIMAIQDYAKKHRLKIVDYHIDRPHKGSRAGFQHLHRHIRKQGRIDSIITTSKQVTSFSEYAALKAVLECEGLGLIILLGT